MTRDSGVVGGAARAWESALPSRQAVSSGSAGLRVIRLHDARHGTATLLTAAGVAPRVVMEILGHSQISITMDVYTHVVQDTQREAMSHMDRLLRKRRPGRQ
ncbi:hypothetical protein GCM10027074_58400 [Streptomyces deserti]